VSLSAVAARLRKLCSSTKLMEFADIALAELRVLRRMTRLGGALLSLKSPVIVSVGDAVFHVEPTNSAVARVEEAAPGRGEPVRAVVQGIAVTRADANSLIRQRDLFDERATAPARYQVRGRTVRAGQQLRTGSSPLGTVGHEVVDEHTLGVRLQLEPHTKIRVLSVNDEDTADALVLEGVHDGMRIRLPIDKLEQRTSKT
jgi:hypothetical protein